MRTAVARIKVNGIEIAYEIVGTGKRAAIITPGGRFTKETPGVKGLAEALAKHDFRVVIWDRPNCGESDICFEGQSESILNADTLAGLLRELKLPPALVIGGSAGARVSLIAAIRHPETVERLFLLWISGGVLGVMTLGYVYYHDSWVAAQMGGMQAVVEMPAWKSFVTRDPRNRQYLLNWDPIAFRDKMTDWARSFIPDESTPVPNLDLSQLRAMKMPVMVLRGGKSDPHHPRETSEAVASAIPGATLAEPPWGDKEWLERLDAQTRGEGLFAHWPLLAPQILQFAGK
jgi:pimeloyl-ACP methyl ester carboxylesterase